MEKFNPYAAIEELLAPYNIPEEEIEKYKVSEEELNQILNKKIFKLVFGKASPVNDPAMVINGGQPGSRKKPFNKAFYG